MDEKWMPTDLNERVDVRKPVVEESPAFDELMVRNAGLPYSESSIIFEAWDNRQYDEKNVREVCDAFSIYVFVDYSAGMKKLVKLDTTKLPDTTIDAFQPVQDMSFKLIVDAMKKENIDVNQRCSSLHGVSMTISGAAEYVSGQLSNYLCGSERLRSLAIRHLADLHITRESNSVMDKIPESDRVNVAKDFSSKLFNGIFNILKKAAEKDAKPNESANEGEELDEDSGEKPKPKTILIVRKNPSLFIPNLFDDFGAVVIKTDNKYAYLGHPQYYWYYFLSDTPKNADEAHMVPLDKLWDCFERANNQQSAKFMKEVSKIQKKEEASKNESVNEAGGKLTVKITIPDEKEREAFVKQVKKNFGWDIYSYKKGPVFGITVEKGTPHEKDLKHVMELAKKFGGTAEEKPKWSPGSDESTNENFSTDNEDINEADQPKLYISCNEHDPKDATSWQVIYQGQAVAQKKTLKEIIASYHWAVKNIRGMKAESDPPVWIGGKFGKVSQYKDLMNEAIDAKEAENKGWKNFRPVTSPAFGKGMIVGRSSPKATALLYLHADGSWHISATSMFVKKEVFLHGSNKNSIPKANDVENQIETYIKSLPEGIEIEETNDCSLDEASGYALKSEIKTKGGEIFPKGSNLRIEKFEEQGSYWKIVFTDGNKTIKIPVATAYKYVNLPKPPGIAALTKMDDNGVGTTITGKRVEPDGKGPDGSPSWLLVLGMI